MARQAKLLPVDEARARVLAHFRRQPAERIAITDAVGRALAEDVSAETPLPPFTNSSMDGFALAAAETSMATPERPAVLRVSQFIGAGSRDFQAVATGECARIMTGAPLPPGADAVIPFEDVEDREESIAVSRPAAPGACVRSAGQDVTAGVKALRAGIVLEAPQIALLAALGRPTVEVARRPVVAILATGDELVPPGIPLEPGQIYNSNSPMLHAALVEGGGEPRTIQTARDTAQAVAQALESARGSDLLVTSGGASVGDLDFVKSVVGSAGELAFWRIRMRPGKPLLFGTVAGMPVIGLPGNPTSALATFEQFVRPAIRTMLGLPPLRPTIEAVMDDNFDNRGGRRTFARVRLAYRGGRYHACLAGGQDSAMLLPLAHADGLLEIPEDQTEMRPGDVGTVQVWRLPS